MLNHIKIVLQKFPLHYLTQIFYFMKISLVTNHFKRKIDSDKYLINVLRNLLFEGDEKCSTLCFTVYNTT